ncbi:hypothetical protein BDZ94DRAFT_816290 [Collybia nuda]|uniref:DUF6534 domain-containing protein n=1 Tax=Collybia nuda TaxID=64659 RepID=A0A9P5Y2Z0_9AGAR|nr:hypothetical protein BDZ94DRAFT_816290 [Collybia nuda]
MPSLQGPTIDNTVGAIFLGVVGAAFLYGVTTLQAYWYYHRFTKDSRVHKYSVGILWVLDTFHLCLTIHAVWSYVVTGFGDVNGLKLINWSIRLRAVIDILVIVIVQCLYAFRVWILSGYHNAFVRYIAAAVVGVGFVMGIILTYQVYIISTYEELRTVGWALTASLGTSTAIDFVLCGAMCFYLRKSKGMGTRLNSRISRLMQYTLSSGLFTSTCSLSAMITYVTLPNTMVFLAVEFLLTKLYIGSFFAMLNARERTREPRDAEQHSSVNFRAPSLPSPSSSDDIVAHPGKISPW